QPSERADRRDERVRRDDHLIPRPEVAELRGQLQRRGARGGHQDLWDSESLLHQPGATAGERPVPGDRAGVDHLRDVLELPTKNPWLGERDRHGSGLLDTVGAYW